jgi:hypothetical protein
VDEKGNREWNLAEERTGMTRQTTILHRGAFRAKACPIETIALIPWLRSEAQKRLMPGNSWF